MEDGRPGRNTEADAHTLDGARNDVDLEQGSLTTSTAASPDTFWTRQKEYWWTQPLRVDSLMEVQLLLLTFSTGIQDAISFPDFSCFASNQTGNTVLLAVAVVGRSNDLINLANIGTSLGCFLLGAICTGQIGNLVGRRRRVWQFGNQLGQIFMVMGTAWIQYRHGVQMTGAWARGALGLLAFSSGMQVAAARAMQIPEITTAMATAAWVDLVIDARLLGLKNHSRDRRLLFLLMLVAGSLCGAFMHDRIGSPTAVVVTGAIKFLVAFALLITKAERPPERLIEKAGSAGPSAMPG